MAYWAHADGFKEAIISAGLSAPPAIEADGVIHRFSTSGQWHDSAGWYVLFPDSPMAGTFGCWRTGEKHNWCALPEKEWSPVDRQNYGEQMARSREVRLEAEKERHQEVAAQARETWEGLGPAPADHAYLVEKAIGPKGLRLGEDGWLVLRLSDTDRQIWSLQRVAPDGRKRFLPGGRKKGCYGALGQPNGVICLVEGWATGASVHAATGHAVAVAMDAGNLEPVAAALRQKLPDIQLIVCADDDSRGKVNVGLVKARAAALACGGLLAVPEFGPKRPPEASDFNDLCRLRGASAVRDSVNAAQPVDTRPEPTAWPEPGPLSAELRPVPPFDAITLLPEPLREWVMDEANRMGSAPDFVAAGVVSAVGSLLGARCAIRPKQLDSWAVVPNLWGAVVGAPGAKKSPALTAAFTPLQNLEVKAGEKFEEECREYAVARQLADLRRGNWKRKSLGKAGQEEGLEQELREIQKKEPEDPVRRRYRTDDPTVEKLAELLRDVGGGLLVFRDELVGLLVSWEKQGHESDRAFYLEAWSGTGSHTVDRIKRGTVEVPRLCLSIFGGLQPGKLLGYFRKATDALGNDGMIQRFQLLVYPDTPTWEYRDREPNQAAADRVAAIFSNLANQDPVEWGAEAPAPGHLPSFRFGPEAQEIYIAWTSDLNRTRVAQEQNELIRQHLTKYDQLFPALALIFHLVDCAAGKADGPIPAEAARRAKSWCDFLEAHARRCYGLLEDSPSKAVAVLVERIQAGKLKDGFTVRDVVSRGWRELTVTGRVERALGWLEGSGWVRGEARALGAKGGRPTTEYRINPQVRRAP